jgi:hypothetical protein
MRDHTLYLCNFFLGSTSHILFPNFFPYFFFLVCPASPRPSAFRGAAPYD